MKKTGLAEPPRREKHVGRPIKEFPDEIPCIKVLTSRNLESGSSLQPEESNQLPGTWEPQMTPSMLVSRGVYFRSFLEQKLRSRVPWQIASSLRGFRGYV